MAYDQYKKLRDMGLSHDEAVRRMEGGQSDTSFKNLPGNILPSLKRNVGDIFGAVKNLFSTDPEKNTVANIARVGAGVVSKAIPGRQQSEDAADAVGRFFKDRYGSPDRFKSTVINDPTGVVLDVASIFTGFGGAAKGGAAIAGKVGLNAERAAQVARVGNTISKIGDVVDPIVQGSKLIGKATSKVAPRVATVASDAVGALTGSGGEAVRQAFLSNSDDFRSALRGEVTEARIVDNVIDALSNLKAARSTEYQKAFAEIGKNKTNLDLSSLHETMKKQLDSFGVNYDPETRTFDFARSTISDGAEANRVQGAVEAIASWGTRSEDLTPVGIDLLKRKLDDFYSPSKEASAFIAPLRSEVKKILVKEIPEYAEMTAKYGEASELINDIRKAVSTGSQSTETIFKRLLLSLKQNQEARLALVKELQKASDVDILGQVSGISMSQWMPRGIIGKGAAIGAGLGFGFGAIQFLLAAGISSPRLVAEFLRLAGVPAKQIPKLTSFYNTLLDMGADRALLQAGRINEETETPDIPQEPSEQTTQQ